MRKLKTLLVLLFAACLSFALFACGGNEEEQKGSDGSTLNRVSGNQIELTDADTQDTFNTKMQTYKLTGSTDDGRVEILGSDCDISGEIKFGEIDRYTVTFKPKENNANGVSTEVVVVIDHAWETKGDHEVCKVDGATKITKDEDIAIHYGNFHTGTGIGPSGEVVGAATAIPQVLLTEDDAALLGLQPEKQTTDVFNTAAGINQGVTSSGRIKDFGMDERANKVVPTITAGDLAPGMSITIEGYAKTDVAGATQETPGGPWNVTNGNWNCPSYGIADPYSPLCTLTDGGINVGTAVIVRSEGWVLYNGIGQELNNTLGGLPKFIEGGKATESGSTEDSNCASWDRATANILDGQDVTNRPAYTSSDWKNWWVYSEGTDRHSLDSYQSFIHVRVTWTYRTYGEGDDQVGIIVIDSDYLDEDTTFRSYIKVPAATRGAYRTIIHGDYSTLLITKSTYVETETVTGMRVNGLKADAKTKYLEGEQIDAGAVFDMQVTSEQNANWHDGGIAVTNDMLYYYKGTGTTYEEAEAAIDTAADWEAVGNDPLTANMKFFKIVLERADGTFEGMVPKADCAKFVITANNVAGAVGDGYADSLNSRDPMATFTRTRGEKDDTPYVDLKIDKALFREIPDTALGATGIFDAAFTDSTDYLFTTIRLLGINAFDDLGAGEDGKSVGTVDSNTYYYSFKKDGDDMLLAVAIKSSLLGKELVIEGVQDTAIRLTFGTGSLGFEVTSSITATKPTLNGGGDVTITYKNLPEGDIVLRVFAGGNSAIATQYLADLDGATADAPKSFGANIQVTGYSKTGTTATVTFKFPAFDFANWTTMPYVRATSGTTHVVAEDYIEYNLGTITGNETNSENGVYFTESDGKLYFVTAHEAADGEKVDFETIIPGGTGATAGKTVNINNGDEDKANSFNLTYTYGSGTFVFADKNLGSAIALKTIVLEKAYGDYGVLVVASVDVKAATGIEGDYGFQIGGAATNDQYYWKYDADATGEKLTRAAVGSGAQKVVKQGDCYTTGIVATEVKSGDDVVFLAGYTEIGGDHVDDNDDGRCDLCGMEINTLSVSGGNVGDWKWSNDSLYMKGMQVGDVYDFEATFIHEPIYLYGNVGIVAAFRADTHLYWMRSDGWMKRSVKDVWDDEQLPVSADETYMAENDGKTNSDLWTDLPFNTLNGVKTIDGETLDTLTAENFQKWIADKDVRIIARVLQDQEKGTYVDVEWLYYKGTMLVLNYHQGFKVTDPSTLSVGINYDTNVNVSKAQYVKSTVNKSVIGSAAGVDLSGVANTATFDTDGFDADGNAVIKVGGMANKSSAGQFYINFKVNFSVALPTTTAVAVKGVTGATATLGNGNTELTVYVPLTKGSVPDVTIEFTNKEAATLQANIALDLSEIGVSGVTATVAGDTNLTLAKGTFTITYENGDQTADKVVATDKIAVGTTEVALSAIKTTETEASDLGNGLKVYSANGVQATGITLTFVKAEADITKDIPGYTIVLKRGEGTLASSTIAPARTVGTGFGQQIGETGWYAKATGTTLYLLSNGNNPSSLPVNINAGHATTDKEMLGVSDLAFTVDAQSKIHFNEYSVLYPYLTGAYYGNTDSHLIVLTIGLTALGIQNDTPYGIAIEDADNTTKAFYTVAATTRAIGTVTTALNTTQLTLAAASCTATGIKAYGNAATEAESTYFGNITFEKGHHTFDAQGKCTACNEASGWFVDNVRVGKIDNSVGFPGDAMVGGEHKAYNPAEGEKNSSIVKGQKITAKGVVSSSGTYSFNGIAILFYPGVAFSEYPTMHIRGDAWVNGLGNRTGGTDSNSHLTYVIDSKINTTEAYDDAKYIAIAKLAKATIVWDWTNDDQVVITYTLEGIQTEGTYVLTVTITPEGTAWAANRYSIGIAPDSGSFTGTIECVCAANFENPNPEKVAEVHTHGNWNEQDRCPADGFLKTDHVHSFTEGVCKCGAKQNEVTVGGQTYTSDMDLVYGFKNNDTDGNWWNGNTDNVKMDNGNYIVVITASKTDAATHDLNYCDLCPEITEDGTSRAFTANIQDFPANTGDGTYIWYFDNEIDGNAWSAKTVSNITGTKPVVGNESNAGWKGDYKITFIRLGTSFTIIFEFTADGSEAVTYSATVTLTIGTTAVNAHISGSPVFAGNFQAWSGALTAKTTD